MEINENSRRYYFAIDSKWIFVISILVVVSTIIGVWQFGIGQHRTLYFNSLISTTIISILFFLFITIGLYKGITLKDNTNDFAEKISSKHIPDLTKVLDLSDADIPEIGDGIGGIILGILAWICLTVVLFFVIWFFGAVLWVCIFVFATILYWLFYKASSFVLQNSYKCKDKLVLSAFYGITHTVLFNFWIYGIIYFAHQIK